MSANLFQTIRRPVYGQGQNVTYTGTAGTITNALPQGTASVWLYCSTAAYVKIGASPTATTADFPIPANSPVIIPLDFAAGEQAQLKVSAVQVASGGSLYVIPMAD